MISLTSVSRELRLPGAFGGMIGQVFHYFEEILEGKGRVSARRLVESIDEILLSIFPSDRAAEATPIDRSTTWLGGTLLALIVGGSVMLAVLY